MLRWTCIFLFVLMPAAAYAQDVPAGALGHAQASSGTTDVAAEQTDAPVQRDLGAHHKDANELSGSMGMLQTGGNARVFAATAGVNGRVRRGDDQAKMMFAANYGQAAAQGQDWRTNVENLQGLVRYDHFVDRWVLFFASQGRHDRFQGLDVRLSFDPGAGYYFLDTDQDQLWVEAGYDLRYDIRRDDALVPVDDKGNPIPGAAPLDKTTVVHSGRAFAGYLLRLGAATKLSAGIELLESITDSSVYRVNGDLTLTTKLRDKWSVALAFSERYEHRPLPGKLQLDTASSAAIVYTFF